VGDGYDGIHCFNPQGKLIGQIELPETGANLCLGGEKRNRWFIAASTSVYAVYVETQGAHFCGWVSRSSHYGKHESFDFFGNI
jgi:gluconolactonase